MKDPLDNRDDPYERVNAEAKRQTSPTRIAQSSKSKDIRSACLSLKARAENPEQVQDAYDRLTQPERRIKEDIFFYCVGDSDALAQPLPEPSWQYEPLELPDLPIDAGLLRIVTGDESRLITSVPFREVSLSPLTRYDDVQMPTLAVTFKK